MKLKKALKTLESKGTGFVFKMSEMETNYNPEKFVKDIQTYGYVLTYGENDKPTIRMFKWCGNDIPYTSLDFRFDFKPEMEDDDGWGYYSFGEFFRKFNISKDIYLPINFGAHTIVHKSTEADISLYRT